MVSARTVCAGQVRLGMRLAGGGEITEIVRPHRDAVRRGYGRVMLGITYLSEAIDRGPQGTWAYYPNQTVTLAEGDDSPLDHTMDEWPGRWWKIEHEA